jgi:hypothetical protein
VSETHDLWKQTRVLFTDCSLVFPTNTISSWFEPIMTGLGSALIGWPNLKHETRLSHPMLHLKRTPHQTSYPQVQSLALPRGLLQISLGLLASLSATLPWLSSDPFTALDLQRD